MTIVDGAVVRVKRKPSDSMLRMLLMASNPDKFGTLAGGRREAVERALRPRIAAELRAEAAAADDPDSPAAIAFGAKMEAEFERIERRLRERR